ncbi:hypothetical protein FACS189441_5370 [Betaproteobacteria bacterium]|nr:hypothetical protein FACS189441_5370 [Betaproteobacteria bacterium]
MSIKVEIKSAEVEVKSGTSNRTGKPYSIREQVGWGFFVDSHGKPQPYPQRIRLTIEDGEEPYAPGTYQLAPSSFYPDRFGQLSCRAKLQPIAAAASARAAA